MTSANDSATVCIANIGPRERRKRLGFGLVLLGIGVVGAFILVVADVGRAWRMALFLPFWAGALGVLQAREKT